MDIYQDYIEGCLIFQNPTHHNNGNYTLTASNYLGVATSSVYGHFIDKPFDGESDPCGRVESVAHHVRPCSLGDAPVAGRVEGPCR